MLERVKFVSILVLALFGSPALAADQPLVDDAQLAKSGLSRFWQAKLPLPKGDTIDTGYLVDDQLYVVTDGGGVYALTAREGLIRWAEQLTERDYVIYRPTHLAAVDDNGPVIIPTTTRVFIIDRVTGRRLYAFTPKSGINGPIVGADDKLFLGSADGRAYSLQLVDWRPTSPLQRWMVTAGGAVTAAPILDDNGMLLFASHGGQVYYCDALDKTLHWSYPTGGAINGDPAMDDLGVYVASMDRSLYKIHRQTGRMLWRYRMPQPLHEGPTLVGETIYQYGRDQGLTAIDSETGDEKWRIKEGRSLIAHTVPGDFVFTQSRKILLVDHDNGSVVHTVESADVSGAVVNTRDAAIFLLAKDGRVLCARTDDVPYLKRQQMIAATARLNRTAKAATNNPLDGKRIAKPKRNAAADDPLKSRWDRP